ncbi:hypothetical protein [Chroococcus sp. FPU101]|uniref:hypothetical protein n=1 Tax=Chroococcus sp. FPU101 TaxID=1974212 RepID=UPI001A8D3098|nr:hypothetical protein [Chroococcus sp. FPU101]
MATPPAWLNRAMTRVGWEFIEQSVGLDEKITSKKQTRLCFQVYNLASSLLMFFE